MNSINIKIYGDIIKLPHHESNTRPQMSKALLQWGRALL